MGSSTEHMAFIHHANSSLINKNNFIFRILHYINGVVGVQNELTEQPTNLQEVCFARMNQPLTATDDEQKYTSLCDVAL